MEERYFLLHATFMTVPANSDDPEDLCTHEMDRLVRSDNEYEAEGTMRVYIEERYGPEKAVISLDISDRTL